MKIVTYNIQFGLGKGGIFDLEKIAGEVNGADIIALQEVERYWQRSGNVDQPALLGKFLPDYYWAYGPYFDVDASTCLPDGRIKNVRRQFGNMILSKTPIISTRLFPLPKSIINDQRNMAVGLLEGVVELPDGKSFRIYNAHLSAKSVDDRISQIHAIRKIIAQAPNEGGTWTGPSTHPLWLEDKIAPPMPAEFLLLGDFNLAPRDREYDHLLRPGSDETIELPKPLDIDPEHLAIVREGMWAVVNEGGGTAGRARIPIAGVQMAGKTGTSQVNSASSGKRSSELKWEQRDHALFVGFAPADNPRYAVAAVIEHGGSGSRAASPVVRDIMTALIERDPLSKPTYVARDGRRKTAGGMSRRREG